jgi:hypothetical protein
LDGLSVHERRSWLTSPLGCQGLDEHAVNCADALSFISRFDDEWLVQWQSHGNSADHQIAPASVTGDGFSNAGQDEWIAVSAAVFDTGATSEVAPGTRNRDPHARPADTTVSVVDANGGQTVGSGGSIGVRSALRQITGQ